MSSSSSAEYAGLVDYSLHVQSPPIDTKMAALIAQFRSELSTEPLYTDHPSLQSYVTDTLLHAYLRARNADLQKAKRLLLGTLEWRLQMKPDAIRAESTETDHKTGKMVVKGLDRHGRPLWVMDSALDNTKKDHDSAINHLLFMLEHAKRKMRDGVEKYCLFIHLENYSMFTAPPRKTSMETLKVLTDRYPEHLGHAVLYQPPLLFHMFFKACKPFLDSKTVSKLIFIRGDCKPGSKNDETLKHVIGENWRELCNVDVPKGQKVYDHEVEWPKLLEEDRMLREEKENEQKEEKHAETSNNNDNPKTSVDAINPATDSSEPATTNVGETNESVKIAEEIKTVDESTANAHDSAGNINAA